MLTKDNKIYCRQQNGVIFFLQKATLQRGASETYKKEHDNEEV